MNQLIHHQLIGKEVGYNGKKWKVTGAGTNLGGPSFRLLSYEKSHDEIWTEANPTFSMIKNNKCKTEESLSAIVKILDEGVDMDSFTYDFQAVNQVHRIAYGGAFPKPTKQHGTEI